MSISQYVYVVVKFLFQLIFIFPFFLGMLMNVNEFKTKEIQKLIEIKQLTATDIVKERSLDGNW